MDTRIELVLLYLLVYSSTHYTLSSNRSLFHSLSLSFSFSFPLLFARSNVLLLLLLLLLPFPTRNWVRAFAPMFMCDVRVCVFYLYYLLFVLYSVHNHTVVYFHSIYILYFCVLFSPLYLSSPSPHPSVCLLALP